MIAPSTRMDEGPRYPPHLGALFESERWIRACDVAIASLALIALSPVLLLIALAVKLDSQGTVLYRQLRVGVDRRNGSSASDGRRTRDMGGQPFVLYKFRTMYTDAERATGPVWSEEGDERVTRVGRFLRRHRLDELPQLWNVLRGHMSIVGPRPERPSIVHDLRQDIEDYLGRQQVRPGITGWAQINQGSDKTVEDVRSKLRYDLEYVERRSFGFDLRIMLETLPVMLEPNRVQERVESPDADGLPDRSDRRQSKRPIKVTEQEFPEGERTPRQRVSH